MKCCSTRATSTVHTKRKKVHSPSHVSGCIYPTTPFHKHIEKQRNTDTNHPLSLLFSHPFPSFLSWCVGQMMLSIMAGSCFLMSNPCINTPLVQKNASPLQLYAKTTGLDSAQGALSALFLVCLLLLFGLQTLHARIREKQKIEHKATDDDGDDDDVVDSQPTKSS